jgi:hypothetical protein
LRLWFDFSSFHFKQPQPKHYVSPWLQHFTRTLQPKR